MPIYGRMNWKFGLYKYWQHLTLRFSNVRGRDLRRQMAEWVRMAAKNGLSLRMPSVAFIVTFLEKYKKKGNIGRPVKSASQKKARINSLIEVEPCQSLQFTIEQTARIDYFFDFSIRLKKQSQLTCRESVSQRLLRGCFWLDTQRFLRQLQKCKRKKQHATVHIDKIEIPQNYNSCSLQQHKIATCDHITTKAVLRSIQNSCGCEASRRTVTSRLVLSPQELIWPCRSSARQSGTPTSRRASFSRSFFRTAACTYSVRSRCSTPSSRAPWALMLPPSSLMPLIPYTPARLSLGSRLQTSSTRSQTTAALWAASFLMAMKNSRGLEKALRGKILLTAVRAERSRPLPMPRSSASEAPSLFSRCRSALNFPISLLTQSSLWAMGSMGFRKACLRSSEPSACWLQIAASLPTTECEYSESGLMAGCSPKMLASFSLMSSMSSPRRARSSLPKRAPLRPSAWESPSSFAKTLSERRWLMRMFILARSMSSASLPTQPISPSMQRSARKSISSGTSFLASSSRSMLHSQRSGASGPSASCLSMARAWRKSAVWNSYLRFQPQGLYLARLLTRAWRQAITKASFLWAGWRSGTAALASRRQCSWLRMPEGCSMRYLWQQLVSSSLSPSKGVEMSTSRKFLCGGRTWNCCSVRERKSRKPSPICRL